MTTDLVAVTRDLRVIKVFEALFTGQATTISQACEVADVPRSTFYTLVEQGYADAFFAELRKGIVAEALGQISQAIPNILAGLIAESTDASLSARDRQDARRTLLAYFRELSGAASDEGKEEGETAADWLKKQRFSPVQINVAGDLVLGKEQSPPGDVVEGSVEEMG